MRKRTVVIGVAAVLVLGGAFAVKQRFFAPAGAVAQAPRQGAARLVPVDVATAVKREVPLRVDLIGTVTPIASVAVKTRIDTEIVGVHFKDGAMVKTGDP